MAFHSRHVTRAVRYTSPFRDEQRFLDDMETIIKRERIDVLVPVLEETYMIARNRQRLGQRVGLLLADYSAMLALHDKGLLRQLAASCGVAMPATRDLADIARDEALAEGLAYPVVVKPMQGGGGWAVEEATTPQRLCEIARERTAAGCNSLVQQKVCGDTVCVAMLYDGGTLLASDAYRTLETYPWPYGQATLRESTRCLEAEQGLQRLLDAVGWTGVCEADFIVDAATGRAYLIDVNPRFWGSLVQSMTRGIDFPYYYYKLAVKERDFSPAAGKDGVVTRWLGGDVLRFGACLKGAPRKLDFLLDAMRRHRSAAAHDDFELSDPLPLLAWCGGNLLRRFSPFARDADRYDALRGVWE
ncbi:ATP-grasp domain-containing protein [Nitratidesulfovibrio sp.]|uniref:carboxylate--amine ligase n=1 Tax=Nitratidesulfovibrio sp. TaxID=2802297 RepID=UPI003340E9CB